jgi:hypothetical protein
VAVNFTSWPKLDVPLTGDKDKIAGEEFAARAYEKRRQKNKAKPIV